MPHARPCAPSASAAILVEATPSPSDLQLDAAQSSGKAFRSPPFPLRADEDDPILNADSTALPLSTPQETIDAASAAGRSASAPAPPIKPKQQSEMPLPDSTYVPTSDKKGKGAGKGVEEKHTSQTDDAPSTSLAKGKRRSSPETEAVSEGASPLLPAKRKKCSEAEHELEV
ncbi:hypothetical protein JCM10207_007336 [Rhodosporidiobolus poonsookiae]